MTREETLDKAKAVVTKDRNDQYGLEEWRGVGIFSKFYEVSNKGRVRTIAHKVIRKNGRPHTVKERILKQPCDEWGYPMVKIGGHTVKVHRLVANAFLGKKEDGMEIRHLDGNPKNNNVTNLKYGTHSENMRDAYSYRGCIMRNQKLSPDKASEIKRRLSNGERGLDLANEFCVSPQTICDIKHKRIYAKEVAK